MIVGLSLITGCNDTSNNVIEKEGELNATPLGEEKISYTTLVTEKGLIITGGKEGIRLESNSINRNTTFQVPIFKSKEKLNRSVSISDVKIYAIVEQNDGKILIGGNFSSVNGIKANSLVRLNFDGTIDSSFMHDNLNINGEVYTIKVIDEAIFIGGYFNQISDGVTAQGLVKLNMDGSINKVYSELNNNVLSVVNDIEIANDNIFIAGSFLQLEENGDIKEKAILKIDSNDIINDEFNLNTNILYGQSFKIVQTDTENLMIAGDFTLENNQSLSLLKLDMKGNIEQSSFLSEQQGLIFDMEYKDNTLFIGGDFVINDNGTIVKGFAMYKNEKLIQLKNLNVEADIYDITFNKDKIILSGEGNYTINKNDTFQNSIVLNLGGN
jgi:signal peptidase I